MGKKINQLPVVVTCFAYRSEYFPELEGMLVTLREHHPEWTIVVGRGPVEGYSMPTLEVEGPGGKVYWSLPVRLDLDGSENDWCRVTRIKGWWIKQVWDEYGEVEGERKRVVWIDADARLNGPLDIELDSEAELLAAAFDCDPDRPDEDDIGTGLLVLQGSKGGVVEGVLDEWSRVCLRHIENLPPSSRPWPDSDQEVLNEILKGFDSQTDFVLLKLEHDKYAGEVKKDGTRIEGTLVDQWQMNRKMKFPEMRNRDWPPPEEIRRRPVK